MAQGTVGLLGSYLLDSHSTVFGLSLQPQKGIRFGGECKIFLAPTNSKTDLSLTEFRG